MSLHRERVHPEPVEGCFGCKVSTLSVSAAITLPHNENARRQHSYQHGFAAEFTNGDREAYVRLRANRTQPPTIAGSAHLEKHARTRFEIESGVIAPDAKKLDVALRACADRGLDPLKADIKPVVT